MHNPWFMSMFSLFFPHRIVAAVSFFCLLRCWFLFPLPNFSLSLFFFGIFMYFNAFHTSGSPDRPCTDHCFVSYYYFFLSCSFKITTFSFGISGYQAEKFSRFFSDVKLFFLRSQRQFKVFVALKIIQRILALASQNSFLCVRVCVRAGGRGQYTTPVL